MDIRQLETFTALARELNGNAYWNVGTTPMKGTESHHARRSETLGLVY